MTTDKARRFLDSLLEKSIRPNVGALARILLRGEIAVLLHDPAPFWNEALAAMGWDGRAKVFALDGALAMRTIGQSDPVTAAWVQRRCRGGVGRIFVVARAGSLLVNYQPGKGYRIEPGSTDGGSGARGAPATQRIWSREEKSHSLAREDS